MAVVSPCCEKFG